MNGIKICDVKDPQNKFFIVFLSGKVFHWVYYVITHSQVLTLKNWSPNYSVCYKEVYLWFVKTEYDFLMKEQPVSFNSALIL